MPRRKKRPYSISASALYCPTCQAVRLVAYVDDTSASFDAACLECGHSRSAYLPPSKEGAIGIEDLKTPEGVAAFPGEPKSLYGFTTSRKRTA